MNEKASNEAQIVESWIDLANTTMAGYPAEPIVEALAQAQHKRKEDPWVTLIDRLWDINPVSEVVPIDFGEIVSIFQRVWLDALRNPTRLWGLYSDFVLQSTSDHDQQHPRVLGSGHAEQAGHRAGSRR